MKRLLLLSLLILLPFQSQAALVLGTNCGFVSSAPVDDPDGSGGVVIDSRSNCDAHTSPSGATAITEMGAYFQTADEVATVHLGLYEYDAESNTFTTRLYDSGAFSSSGSPGWEVASGLSSWTISGSHTYGLGVSCSNTTNATYINNGGNGSAQIDQEYTFTNPLPETWSGTNYGRQDAIYAVAARRMLLIN